MYAARANVPDFVVENAGSTVVTYRVIADHLGTPRCLVRASDGVVVHELDVDEWGRVLRDTGAKRVFLPHGFAGGLWDRDTGLVRFGARDYDAETGRWTARDPILFGGGDSNLYAYVGNDPINRLDPTGEFAWIAGGIVAGAAGDLGLQLYGNGGDLSKVDWGEVAAGAVVGGVLASGLEFVAGSAFSATSTSGSLVAVTQWGAATSPWVMVGGNTIRNWLLSGVAEKGYRIGTGVTRYVDKAELRYPSGTQWIKGLWGQRILCEK